MFGRLTERLQEAFRNLRRKGKLTEQDVDEALRQVRLALLEADVNYKVVKDFITRIRERAVGQEVLKSLTPAQQVIKIVHQELIFLLGGEKAASESLQWSSSPPTVVMLVGLHGAGKTTTAAKLGLLWKKQGKRPLLVAADTYRPAAVDQLRLLGERWGIPVYTQDLRTPPEEICTGGVKKAQKDGYDVVILDTAGRLHLDQEMMAELGRIKEGVRPHEILLVVDAMTGQDAVQVASSFQAQLGITGVILTKLDGDARGGAALSTRAVTGRPVKFVGVGEGPEDLEVFHPDRMASRILGMGDVLTLIEKAEASIDVEEAKRLEAKLRHAEFTLNDFLQQLRQMKKMGGLEQLLKLLPGAGKLPGPITAGEKDLKKIEAIILSMTKEERENPAIIDGSRRRRIAKGSGTTIQDVNRLLKQYEQTKQLLKQMSSWEKRWKKGFSPLFP